MQKFLHDAAKITFCSPERPGSYLYFHNHPNIIEFDKETRRITQDLQYYDVLRSDKSVSCAGLEVRVAFLDKEFMEFYMSIITDYIKHFSVVKSSEISMSDISFVPLILKTFAYRISSLTE